MAGTTVYGTLITTLNDPNAFDEIGVGVAIFVGYWATASMIEAFFTGNEACERVE